MGNLGDKAFQEIEALSNRFSTGVKTMPRRPRGTSTPKKSKPASKNNKPKLSKSTNSPLWLTIIMTLVRIVGLVYLPFFVLVFTALRLYKLWAMPVWIAVAAGGFLTTVLLAFYLSWLINKISSNKVGFIKLLIFSLVLVVGYCSYGLMHLSQLNAKTAQVQSEFSTLHPILRIALSTQSLLDPNFVITDVERSRADYRDMGLKTVERSMHYKQRTGYTHAADLRTIHRSEWRNIIARAWFDLLGFRTFRHGGTADHIHVSLPVP